LFGYDPDEYPGELIVPVDDVSVSVLSLHAVWRTPAATATTPRTDQDFNGFSEGFGAAVPRNIIAGLKITPPRRTLRRNKFAGGEHIPGENPPGREKIMSPP